MPNALHLTQPRSIRCRNRQPGPPRYGFTLLEVLLVMALMVVISMLAGINLRGSFRQQRLLKGAEQVRSEWTRARVEAIKAGRVQVFYHTMQGNRSLVMPQVSLDDPLFDVNASTSQNSRQQSFGQNSLQQSYGQNSRQASGFSGPVSASLDVDAQSIRQRELPKGVMFLGADVQIDERSAIQLNQSVDPQSFSQFDRSSASDQLGGEQWGTPIYFFPDGTSSTARLVLMNDRDEIVRVYLRGLTGLVRVGRVEQAGALGEQETFR